MPLPQVLKTYIMDPIGASNTWRWNGYRNSWIVLDGQAVLSKAFFPNVYRGRSWKR